MPRPRTVSDAAILEATGRLIAEQGLSGVTFGAVAARAGLSPATLVQRFGSKRGLLLAYARTAVQDARTPFTRARAEHDDPLQAMRAGLTELAAGIEDRRELAGHVSFLHLDLTDPEFHEHARTFTLAMRQEIADLLARAVADGSLTSGTDPRRLARTVQIAYNGALIVWALSGEGSLRELLAETLDDALRPHLA